MAFFKGNSLNEQEPISPSVTESVLAQPCGFRVVRFILKIRSDRILVPENLNGSNPEARRTGPSVLQHNLMYPQANRKAV